MRQLINKCGLRILSEHEGSGKRCYVCKQRFPIKELVLGIEHQTSIHGTYIYIYEETASNNTDDRI
jgi:hypothetical protein